MVRQQQRFLKGKKNMSQQVKIEWDMSLPEDQSENGRNIGSWTAQENLLYVIFINQHKSIMVSKKKRKNCRVFDLMADFVVSRNSLQCRSHHQKLIEKFSEIKKIIHVFKKYFGNQVFRQQSLVLNGRTSSANHQQKISDNVNIPAAPEVNEPMDAPFSPSEGSHSCGEPEIKTPELSREDEVPKEQNMAGNCKSEELLQYYCPYNYYFANNVVQVPFFNGYYPAFVYE